MNNIPFTEYEVDEFSGSVFKDLIVLGKLPKSTKVIHYLCKCEECSKDPELFGDGYFYSTKAHLKIGQLPCGCGKAPRWNEDQALIVLRRELEKDNFLFLEVQGNYKGTQTKYIFSCPKHGTMYPKTFSDLMSGRRCKECAWDKAALSITKSDEDHIREFFFSGKFHPDTIFWRSERESSIRPGYRKPSKNYWFYICGECGERSEHLGSELKTGAKGCSCGTKAQKVAYLHLLKDGEVDVALKFGITKRPLKRLKQQKRKTHLDVVPLGEWHFDTTESCKDAERFLKNTLESLVICKTDFEDGYTETTSIRNLDYIKEVFEKYGGVFQ